MVQVTQQEKMTYVVLPKATWEKRLKKSVPTLRVLREAISKAWHGRGAVDEIRAQRQK